MLSLRFPSSEWSQIRVKASLPRSRPEEGADQRKVKYRHHQRRTLVYLANSLLKSREVAEKQCTQLLCRRHRQLRTVVLLLPARRTAAVATMVTRALATSRLATLSPATPGMAVTVAMVINRGMLAFRVRLWINQANSDSELRLRG
jgi:hypothetical protein